MKITIKDKRPDTDLVLVVVESGEHEVVVALSSAGMTVDVHSVTFFELDMEELTQYDPADPSIGCTTVVEV